MTWVQESLSVGPSRNKFPMHTPYGAVHGEAVEPMVCPSHYETNRSRGLAAMAGWFKQWITPAPASPLERAQAQANRQRAQRGPTGPASAPQEEDACALPTPQTWSKALNFFGAALLDPTRGTVMRAVHRFDAPTLTVVTLAESRNPVAALLAVRELPGQVYASLASLRRPQASDQQHAALRAAMRLDWLEKVPECVPPNVADAVVGATVVAVTDQHVHVAHLGRSRALLCFNDETLRLTVDHSLDEPTEAQRALPAPLQASNTTRALSLRAPALAHAQITSVPLFLCAPSALVLLSQNVAEVLTDADVLSCVRAQSTRQSTQQAAAQIVRLAEARRGQRPLQAAVLPLPLGAPQAAAKAPYEAIKIFIGGQ